MELYTKKPVTIEAIQWNGENANEILEWGKGKITLDKGRPPTVHSLACLCKGRGLIPKSSSPGELENCPEIKPTGAVPVQLVIQTLEGTMRAFVGDWIIKGVKGEFYPCKPDIFEATYEKASQPKNLTSQAADLMDLAYKLDDYSAGTVRMDGGVDVTWPKYYKNPGTVGVTMPAPVASAIRRAADIIAATASEMES